MKCQFIFAKLKCITVEPVLFLYMMIIFLETNALQELISVKSCLIIYNPVNISFCSNKTVKLSLEQEKTYWIRFNGAALFFFTFVGSFFVASWSDKFGRKFPMLIPPLGSMIAASINFALSYYIHSHVAYILISSSISGITFGSVGIITATFGFVTDISDESARTKRMMIMEAMVYTGGTLGIYIGGQFLHHMDYDLTLNGFSLLFIFEISIAAVITLYIIFRIPSRSNESSKLTVISCENLFQFDHVKNSVKAVFRARDAGKRKELLLLSSALCLIFCGLVVQFTLVYYFLDRTLSWEFSKYSDFNSIQFAVEGLALLVGMPIFLHFLKVSDYVMAALGIISKMAGYIVFGLSNSDYLVYSCIALYMFSEYPVPAIRSKLSKIVDSDERGRIFAFTTMLQNFCFLLGSLIFTTIYKSSLTVFPGLCFEIVASLQAIALFIIVYLYITRRETVTTYEIMENEDGPVEETRHIVRSSGSINYQDN